jgi:hypothetical protein
MMAGIVATIVVIIVITTTVLKDMEEIAQDARCSTGFAIVAPNHNNAKGRSGDADVDGFQIQSCKLLQAVACDLHQEHAFHTSRPSCAACRCGIQI